MKYYALTFVTKDRPGVVAEVSKILYEKGFNIADSSSTRLREVFSMILIVSHTAKLSEQEIAGYFTDLVPSVHHLEDSSSEMENGKEHYILSVYGADKPGIVHGITAKLAGLGINIIDLQTQLVNSEKGPYIMILEVLADGADESWFAPVKAEAKEIGTDITIRKLDVFEL